MVKLGDLSILPFSESQLTPNGYDVTVAEVAVPSEALRVHSGSARITPLARFAIATREEFRLPPNLTGQIWLRTTWARKGILAAFGMIDAGFAGTLTFGGLNGSSDPVDIPCGERFAQVVFLTLDSAAEATYDRRSGTYQGQRGVTLDRP